MHKDNYYSSGEFAKMAGVSVRTIRFYDQKDILKPSYLNDSGARFYTDQDLARLQQILLLKYLGFSLKDIKELIVDDNDWEYMKNSLRLQRRLISDKMEQMELVQNAIDDTIETLKVKKTPDWNHMLNLIHLTSMEQSLKTQYQNASNIDARINLHKNYSTNSKGWFPWMMEQASLKEGMEILEIGCGNGELWRENLDLLPKDIHILLSDISDGMIRDVRRNLENDHRFSFACFDCAKIPLKDHSVDFIFANHVLFYCENLQEVLKEITRVLKKDGTFICSTYSANHMGEITKLVQDFDSRIVLSGERLYEKFGLENGYSILANYFDTINKKIYQDSIFISDEQPLLFYILSCHGNQNQILFEKYSDFRSYVRKKVKDGFTITKEAGIFYCTAPY